VAAAIGTVVEYRGDVDSGAFEHGPFTSVFHVLARPTFYLWKTVVPFGLSPYYELQSWSLVFAILSAIAMSVGMSVIRRGWPALVICWICYLVLLIPVPGGNPGGQQLLTDRHTYLSCLPWALLFGAAVLYSWHTRMRSGAMPWAVSVGSGFLAFVLIGLWVLTCAQTQVWHDSETLWRHSAAVSHSSQAHLNLAALLEKQGKSNDALTSYKKALELDAQRWDAHEKAALLLQKQGKIREAVEQFQRVVQINPAATDSRDNLASGLVTLGEVGDAVQHFRKVLELAPDRNETRIKLATILAVEGELAEAEQLFERVVKAQPTDPKVLLKLGQVSAAQGNLHKALAYFQQALRLQPQDAEIHESLGRALQELGRGDEAVKHLQEALRILKSSPASR
jgi:tetratricopeptide (TPR) repeat protein